MPIRRAYRVKYNPNHETAARTPRNVLAVAHVINGNLEAVAAGAGVVVYLQGLVIEAVLDFHLVVQVHFFVCHVARGVCGKGCEDAVGEEAAAGKHFEAAAAPPLPLGT